MTAHVHAELMALYAQDALETETPWELWECQSAQGGEQWRTLSQSPSWADYIEYRRKPRTINAVGMTFGDALEALKVGKRVARAGWNDKGMWLELVSAADYSVHGIPAVTSSGEAGTFRRLPWIGMKTAGNEFVPWLTSQTDALAEDWGVVE